MKTFSVVLILILVLILAGCSGEKKQEQKKSEAQTPEPAPADTGVKPPVAEEPQAPPMVPGDSARTVSGEAMVVLRSGDISAGYRFFVIRWSDRQLVGLPGLDSEEARRVKEYDVRWNGTLAFVLKDLEDTLFVRDLRGTIPVVAPFHDEHLYSWSSDGTSEFKREPGFPSFKVSPNGRMILAYGKRDYALVDSSVGVLYSEFLAARLEVGDSLFQIPARDTVVTDGVHADAQFQRFFEGWAPDNEDVALFSDFDPGQLSSVSKGLWRYHTLKRSFTLATAESEITLDISLDGKYVLYTNNDETCCSGINYTDNLLILRHLGSRQERILYNEWGEFGNADKAEEHVPRNAGISPDNRWIVATIRNFRDWNQKSSTPESVPAGTRDSLTADYHVVVIGTDGKESKKFREREFRGWLDTERIIVQPVTEWWTGRSWQKKTGELLVLSVFSGIEEPFLPTPADLVGVQWKTEAR